MFDSAGIHIHTPDASSIDPRTSTSGCDILTPACASLGCRTHRTSGKSLHNSARTPTLPLSCPVPPPHAPVLPYSPLQRPDISLAAPQPLLGLYTLASISR